MFVCWLHPLLPTHTFRYLYSMCPLDSPLCDATQTQCCRRIPVATHPRRKHHGSGVDGEGLAYCLRQNAVEAPEVGGHRVPQHLQLLFIVFVVVCVCVCVGCCRFFSRRSSSKIQNLQHGKDQGTTTMTMTMAMMTMAMMTMTISDQAKKEPQGKENFEGGKHNKSIQSRTHKTKRARRSTGWQHKVVREQNRLFHAIEKPTVRRPTQHHTTPVR